MSSEHPPHPHDASNPTDTVSGDPVSHCDRPAQPRLEIRLPGISDLLKCAAGADSSTAPIDGTDDERAASFSDKQPPVVGGNYIHFNSQDQSRCSSYSNAGSITTVPAYALPSSVNDSLMYMDVNNKYSEDSGFRQHYPVLNRQNDTTGIHGAFNECSPIANEYSAEHIGDCEQSRSYPVEYGTHNAQRDGDWTRFVVHQGSYSEAGNRYTTLHAPAYRVSRLQPRGGQVMHPTQVQAQQLDPCFYADSGHIPAEYPRPPYPISPHEHFRHHQLHPPSSSNSPFDDGVRLREAPAPHARGASAAAAAVLSPLPPPPSASVRPSPGNYNADAASDQSAQHRPGDGKRRRERSRRYRLAKSQISCMTELFAVDPSPSGEVHAMVSNATGVPRKAVRLWFQNTRARLRRDAKAAGIVNLNTTADLRRFQRNQEQKQGNYSSKISDSATMVEISQQLCNILRMYKEGRYGPVDRRNAAAHHSSAASSAAQDRGVGSGKSDSVDDDEDQDEDESEYDGTK